MNRFSISITGGNLSEPKTVPVSNKRAADAAVAVASALGYTATATESAPGRTAANSLLLRKVKEFYATPIYKEAVQVAREKGLDAVADFIGTKFEPAARDAQVSAMKAIAAEDAKTPSELTPEQKAARKAERAANAEKRKAAKAAKEAAKAQAAGTAPAAQ